jgi:hypothetical protein
LLLLTFLRRHPTSLFKNFDFIKICPFGGIPYLTVQDYRLPQQPSPAPNQDIAPSFEWSYEWWTHSQFMISEKHDISGRPLITLSTSGDIILSVPQGTISLIAKTMTREMG